MKVILKQKHFQNQDILCFVQKHFMQRKITKAELKKKQKKTGLFIKPYSVYTEILLFWIYWFHNVTPQHMKYKFSVFTCTLDSIKSNLRASASLMNTSG